MVIDDQKHIKILKKISVSAGRTYYYIDPYLNCAN